MPLSLIAGPANAGKVELLLDRYLAALDREPVLIVPNRSDVEYVERELIARRPALLGGSIDTFDDVFERIAFAGGDAAACRLEGAARAPRAPRARGRAARRPRGVGALRRLRRRARCGRSGSSSPGCSIRTSSTGDLAALYAAYRAELDRLGLWDRDLLRRIAAERLQSDLGAWHGEPVFAYGFEDLTGARVGARSKRSPHAPT